MAYVVQNYPRHITCTACYSAVNRLLYLTAGSGTGLEIEKLSLPCRLHPQLLDMGGTSYCKYIHKPSAIR